MLLIFRNEKPRVCELRQVLFDEFLLSRLSSVTGLVDFWKFLATKFLPKWAQMIGNFVGSFEKPTFYVKTALATFWATYVIKFGYFFTPTFGHTAFK